MRIWSLHPKYLDRQGLLAVWRETLLAQKVLQGETRGYRRHPQLERFKSQPEPVAAIAAYLVATADEAARRGYAFNTTKIAPLRTTERLPVADGQILYEWEHLRAKLARRDPQRWQAYAHIELPEPHPLFFIVPGPVASWEKTR